MATITAGSIVDKAQVLIQDVTGTRWPETELLGWLNDGQREVVLFKPDASVKNEDFSLVEGTKQTIPAGGVQLLKVVRSRGREGALADGKVVRLIDVRVLDDQLPNWHAATPVVAPDHYCCDQRDPATFYVYPPADGTGVLEIVYSAAPDDVASLEGTISVPDIYANALLDYILYRAYSKDAEYAGNGNRAATHYSQFAATLQGKEMVEMANDPSVKQFRGTTPQGSGPARQDR